MPKKQLFIIDVVGEEDLIAKMSPEKYRRAISTGLRAGAVHVKGKIAVYPPSPSGRSQPFKTDRQRRGFFAKLRSGEIEVPYRRGQSPNSEALGRRWTTGMARWNEAVVGNNASYGEIVQAKDKQSRFHGTTGWKTIEEVANNESDDVLRRVQGAVKIWLNS